MSLTMATLAARPGPAAKRLAENAAVVCVRARALPFLAGAVHTPRHHPGIAAPKKSLVASVANVAQSGTSPM
jgi:hypothetical protein